MFLEKKDWLCAPVFTRKSRLCSEKLAKKSKSTYMKTVLPFCKKQEGTPISSQISFQTEKRAGWGNRSKYQN
jgi:hypothetical protein